MKHKDPKEVNCIFDTCFFVAPENFVDLGLDEFWTKVNDRWTQVLNDKDRSIYQLNQIDGEAGNLSNKRYHSLISNYSTMDFQTLKYLAHLLNIEFDLREWKIVVNSILASFKGHNIFSIFKNHHDTLIEFILEQLDDMRSENEIKRV